MLRANVNDTNITEIYTTLKRMPMQFRHTATNAVTVKDALYFIIKLSHEMQCASLIAILVECKRNEEKK